MTSDRPPRDDRRGLGAWGEDLAVRRLEALGYRILERNYRRPPGEADIIAVDGDDLVVVEVRTRRSLRYGAPAESITLRKGLRLQALLETYRQEHPDAPAQSRVDFVGVVLTAGGAPLVEILRNVIEDGGSG